MVMGSAFQQVDFQSDGATVRGRLYLPDARPLGVVVMAHGFSATIPMSMDAYAERFQERGLAALAFDHRGHGTSDGEPRGEVNYWTQARGYVDAIAFVRGSAALGTLPIAVWSDSLTTRVAMAVTAFDDGVAALVCQVPAMGEVTPEEPQPDHLDRMRRYLDAGQWRRPEDSWVSMPVVSSDQVANPSALEPLTAYRWFIEYGGRYGTGWNNRVMFTAASDAPAFDPFACAPRVRVPTQFVMSPDDEMPGAQSEVTRAVFDRLAGPKELVEVDGGHFGIIEVPSALFDRASWAQADFLARSFEAIG